MTKDQGDRVIVLLGIIATTLLTLTVMVLAELG
jgi:hypothetical protein